VGLVVFDEFEAVQVRVELNDLHLVPAARELWIIDGLVHRARFQLPGAQKFDALPRYRDILRDNVAAEAVATVFERGDNGTADSHVRIEHRIPGLSQ
jgi:hypothetical protein